MRRRFVIWAVIAVGMLGGSSIVGGVVTAVIGPRQYDYSKAWGTAAVRTATPLPQLVNARPTEFGPSKPATPADAALFQTALDGVAAAVPNANTWTVEQHFDFDRMAEELAPLGVYAAVGRQPTEQSVADDAQTFLTAVTGLLNRPDSPFASDRTQVVRVARSKSGSEAIVVARHVQRKDGADRVVYRRWWLRNNPGGSNTRRGWAPAGWRVYDFDEPGTRLRFTIVHAGVIADGTAPGAAGPGGRPVYLNTANGVIMIGADDDAGVAAVRAALVAAADGDRAAALAKLAEARRWRMLPPLAAVRDVAAGRGLLLDAKPAAALAEFDRALKAWGDTPAAHLGRAAALNDLKKPAEALAAVEKFRAAAGDDPEAVREFARAKAGAGDAKAAAEALRAGVREFPEAIGLLVEWYRLAPAEKRGEAGELAANAPDPGGVLAKLLRRVEPADPAGEGAAAVVAGYRAIRPREPVGMVEDALVKVRQRKPADAAKLLRDGLAGLADDEERRDRALREFARGAVRAGRAAEGYEAAAAAGQAAAAFRPLADAALAAVRAEAGKPAAARADQLRAAVAAHAAKHPADPWPHFYRAGLHRSAGDHAAAADELAAGMKKLPPPAPRAERLPAPADGEAVDPRERDWAAFRSARADSLYRLGQWKRAYDELPPKVDTFDQLAGLLAGDGNPDALLELVAAHAKAVPGDADAAVWRVEAHFLKKEYEKVVAACVELGLKAAPGSPVPARVADRWVRALVRLGRPGEAAAMADALPEDAAGVRLRALVAAASGDAQATEAHLYDLRRLGSAPAAAYADPDLGPLLRGGPAFADLRKKFPPPKTK